MLEITKQWFPNLDSDIIGKIQRLKAYHDIARIISKKDFKVEYLITFKQQPNTITLSSTIKDLDMNIAQLIRDVCKFELSNSKIPESVLVHYFEHVRYFKFIESNFKGLYNTYIQYLKSKLFEPSKYTIEQHNIPTKDSYLFKIINNINDNSLPNLDKCFSLISDINSTDDSINVAKQISKIIQKNISRKQSKPTEYYQHQVNFLLDKTYKTILAKKFNYNTINALKESSIQQQISTFNDKSINVIVIDNLNINHIKDKELQFIEKNTQIWCKNERVIQTGIDAAKKLKNKFKAISDNTTVKNINQTTGKFNKNKAYKLLLNLPNIYYTIDNLKQYSTHIVHFSIDSSYSMTGKKWKEVLITLSAIAKSIVNLPNIQLIISFRTCIINDDIQPVLMYAYDSKRDKFDKIKQLFKFIKPYGATPDGLIFQKMKVKKNNSSTNYIFINISDGEPELKNKIIDYSGESAKDHTNKQLKRISSYGIKVINYRIDENKDNVSSLTHLILKEL